VRHNLANFYDRDHNFAMAETTYRDVLERANRTFGPRAWDTGHFTFTYHLGAVLAEEEKKPEAKRKLEQAVAILTKSLGEG